MRRRVIRQDAFAVEMKAGWSIADVRLPLVDRAARRGWSERGWRVCRRRVGCRTNETNISTTAATIDLCGEAMLMLMTRPRMMRPARRAKPAPLIISISLDAHAAAFCQCARYHWPWPTATVTHSGGVAVSLAAVSGVDGRQH